MRRLVKGILVVFLIFLLAVPVYAGIIGKDVQEQLEKLMQQVEEQKKQIESLKRQVEDMQAKETPKVAAPPDEVKTSSKYNVKIYGKIKFDGIYDTNNLGREEFITYIPKNANGEDKATFNVKDTRLGIAIEGPSFSGWTPRGRFETDFYGSDPSSNGGLRIRLAYVDFEKGRTLIRVGQDWNQIAYLNPSTLDFAIMGFNGNLWNRVPQVTIRQRLGGKFEALLTAYHFRWSDDDIGSKVDTQIHMPWIGGKIAYSGKLIDPDKNAYIAFDGAIRNGEAGDNDVTPYLAALELKVPLVYVELTAEAYMGQGLGLEYFHHRDASSDAGAFNVKGHAILTRGGFLQLSGSPLNNVMVNVGYGLDDPKNADAKNDFYQKSQYTFGNVQVQLFKDITVGIEAAHVATDWAAGDEHGTRYQTSLIYNW
jgi:hypothetical protein